MVTSGQDLDLGRLSDSLAQAVDTASKFVVAVDARGRGGATGIMWRPGYVLTADHIIEREENVRVETVDGARFEARVAGRDPATDLAVLSIEEKGQSVAVFEASSPNLGQFVLAIGFPRTVGTSVSFGVISSVGPEWRTSSGGKIDHLLRPDLNMYPGFSGGPLVDVTGHVLGLNTSGLLRGGPVTIPTQTVERIASQLITRGSLARGYLGVRMQAVELPEATQNQLSLESRSALLVVGLEPDGPAANAGLLVGDILLAIQGKTVASHEDVQATLDPEVIGQSVDLKILRGGAPVQSSVAVGERPMESRRRGHHG